MKENISRIRTLKKLLKETKTPHKRDRIKFLLSQVYKIMEGEKVAKGLTFVR